MINEVLKETFLGDIPKSWDIKYLSDILDSLVSGNRPKGGVKNIDEGIPSLGGEHLNDFGSFNFEELKYVPEDFYNNMNKGLLKEKDILICKDGAKTGKISYLRHNPFEKASINEHIFILRGKPDIVNQPYLFYFLFSKLGQDQIKKVITGSAQPGINRKFINPIKVICPPLIEQEKIASILGTLDEDIELTSSVIRKTEELKDGAMQYLLTKGIGNEKFKTVRIGAKKADIPVDWDLTTIDKITNTVDYGLSSKMYMQGQYPIFRMNNIKNGYMIDSPLKYIDLEKDKFNKYKVEKGDILFNRTNSIDLVGKTGIFDLDEDYVFASYLIRLRVNNTVDPFYLNYYMNSYYAKSIFSAIATRGASQANINAKNLKSVSVPLPPLSEQKKIVKVIELIDKKIIKEKEYKEELMQLKKGLMQKLLTGKIRVKVNEED